MDAVTEVGAEPLRVELERLGGTGQMLKVSRDETHLVPVGAPRPLPDAIAEAALVAQDWRGGWDAIIRAGVRIENFLHTANDDHERVSSFINELVTHGVLTPTDAKLGVEKSSKISKLRTIGRHEGTLRLPEVACFLEPSYTALYAIAQLIELLATEKHQQLVRPLIASLQACPGGSMREFLENRMKEIKSARGPGKSSKPTAEPVHPSTVSAQPSLSALIEARLQFDLAVLDITDKRAVVTADYAPGSTLVDCLPLREVMGDAAAVVVRGRTSDISAIVTKLLPACGLPRVSDIVLLRRPIKPSIIEAEVIVIASRGDLQSRLRGNEDWISENESVDLLAIAVQLCPGAVSRLHAFAEAPSEGWTCLVGNDTWVTEPSVR